MEVKVLFQTSRNSQEPYISEQAMFFAPGWEYKHFTDQDALEYFLSNPMSEFPLISEKFSAIIDGPHKADLFRYYYMYQNGGLFIDSDLSIEVPVDTLVGECELMTSYSDIDGRAFNGLLYANKNNKVIYECLEHIYDIDVDYLSKNYHVICEYLLESIKRNKDTINMKLHYWDHFKGEHPHPMYNDSGEVVVIHYWKTKVIPKKTS